MPFDAEEAEDGEENFYDKYKDTLREDVMDYLSESCTEKSVEGVFRFPVTERFSCVTDVPENISTEKSIGHALSGTASSG